MQTLFLFLGVALVISLILSFVLKGKQVQQSIRELLNISKQRVKKLLMEFRRKTFHLLGLLVPGIYYYGLKLNFLSKQNACAIVGILAFGSLFVDVSSCNSLYRMKLKLEERKFFVWRQNRLLRIFALRSFFPKLKLKNTRLY